MKRLRISAISYLNTAPLMWDFEHGDAGEHFDITYTLPSSCARELKASAADIGIIPAAAYTQISDLQILPDVAIASRHRVRSILLISKVPVEKIRSIALDTSSMTSAALTKVIFEKWLGGGRTFTSMSPDIDQMLAQHDAGLLIGDPALQIDRSRYIALDLAEEWNRYTGKPFVFAFWAVRRSALAEPDLQRRLVEIFQRSRDHGLEAANLESVIREWAPRLGLDEATVRTYLTRNIHYYLDAASIEGLELFYRYAAEIGALPAAARLNFAAAAKTCIAL